MDSSRSLRLASFLVAALMASSSVFAQQSSAAPAAAVRSGSVGSVVPRLVNYSGVLQDASGKPITTIRGVTFLLYQDAQGGAPVWMETQNVTPDRSGHYAVQLGATRSQGLPPEMFTSGAARWLAVEVSGGAEQARVLLVSAPYALKAGDADTIGGLPPSAFVLAAPATGSGFSGNSAMTAGASVPPPASSNVTTTGGTINAIPLFTTATNLQNSAITQTGSGTTARIGIGVAAPAAALDIKGGEYVRGVLTLPATGTANAAKGANSQPELVIASVFNGTTSTAVNQKFQLQAEPAGNNTATASGTLNLLYGSGTATPAETGMKINSKGQITFAAGQTFPGTASGTVTSVGLTAPASDFTVSGSPVTTTGALHLAWKAAPTSVDTANAIVKRDATGSFSAGSITGSGTFATTTANGIAIFGSTSLDGGKAIVGSVTATGGRLPVYGVTGNSSSTVAGSTGVLGYDMNTAETGGFTVGVQGFSSNPRGIGVLGVDGSGVSTEFSNAMGSPVGVWGDGGSGQSNFGVGVLGTSADGIAGYFANHGDGTALGALSDGIGDLFSAAGSNGYCRIDTHGNLSCTGTKNAVVPIYGGKRKVAMSAIESPQNWFEDAGSAVLRNGSAVVALDPDFIQTVNTALDYKVFPVPNGDCKGLYVTNKTATSFEVRELGGGTASIRFDYRIMALRRNYENVRFADHTNDLDPRQMLAKMKRRRSALKSTVVPADTATSMPSALQRPATSQ